MTPKSRSIPVEYIQKCFEYREEWVDGILQGNVYWKYREDMSVQWNEKYAGKKTGWLSNTGYYILQITYNNKRCHIRLHVVVWILNKNKYPDGVIDHIDGNKLNNLIENLDDCSAFDNANNICAKKNSTSHFRGVYFNSEKRKFYVHVTPKVNGKKKTIHCGIFADELEAAIKANQVLIEKFGHTKNLRLNDISIGYSNPEYPNMPRGWVPEEEAA